MRQEEQSASLFQELEEILAPLSTDGSFYDLIKTPLSIPNRGLHPNTSKDMAWPLLPLLVSEAISGEWKQTLPAAASVQLLLAAGDVFDDIEDADSPHSLPAKFGSALATNAATTLLILAEQALTRLKTRGVSDEVIVRIVKDVNFYFTMACAGQHLDLSSDSSLCPSESTYLEIVNTKSASQVECACHVGAALATQDQELIKLFDQFGHNMGMAAQITNDIIGITSGAEIIRRKVTLPVVFALNNASEEMRQFLENYYFLKTNADPSQIRDWLFSAGAIQYSVFKSESFKQRASSSLHDAALKGADIGKLKGFWDL